jgi:hypothetical protein
LKDNIIEDSKFWEELVDKFQYVHILIDLFAQILEEHDLIMDRYEQCLKVSIEEEFAKAYLLVKTLCARIGEKYE